MKNNEVINIMKKEIEKSGYRYKFRQSKISDSVYFTIYGACASLYFRISDHKTYKNVVTFRVDRKTDHKKVLNFIKQRIKDVNTRNVCSLLGV